MSKVVGSSMAVGPRKNTLSQINCADRRTTWIGCNKNGSLLNVESFYRDVGCKRKINTSLVFGNARGLRAHKYVCILFFIFYYKSISCKRRFFKLNFLWIKYRIFCCTNVCFCYLFIENDLSKFNILNVGDLSYIKL